MAAGIEPQLEKVAAGSGQAIYLVSGDRVLAEPQAARLAAALAEKAGCELERHRRPADLARVLTDLKTYSLFTPAKVALVVDSAIFADRSGTAELIDQAAEGLPLAETGGLGPAGREAASRLLQALRICAVDARAAGAREALEAMPDWAFEGAKGRRKGARARTAKARKKLREELVPLLEAALAEGLEGFAESDLAALGEVVERGLPEGHALVFAESSVAAEHPVVASLGRRGAVIDLGRVAADKGGRWQGLPALARELEAETGVGIARDALDELARRTLRQSGDWKQKAVDADSTARLAAEYRKLAAMAAPRAIDRALVAGTVQDRGEEDVWQILDALGGGRADEALGRFRRLVASADDAIAARLSFFALLAGFCRQLAAVSGMMRLTRVPPGERSYNRFKTRHAPALQGELEGIGKSPLAGIHPFRLYRAYLAASSMDERELARLPWRVLETEMRIKGESSDADGAIAQLMARVATAGRGRR